jgi:TetR/AcrR family transcriptional repressor of nem operon
MGRPGVKQQLIDAALDVFERNGFNATSVQDLTDAAGVPKGSFYNHFSSKEELAIEALHVYVGQHGIEVLRDSRLDPLERLRRHFRTNWKTVKDRDFRSGCFLGTLSSEISDSHEAARAEFARYFQLWSDELAHVIGEAQRSGAVDASLDRESLARFILNAWQGTLIRAKATRSDDAYKDFLSLVFQTLLAPRR